MAAIKGHLAAHPEIRRLWYDFWAMPQDERTADDKRAGKPDTRTEADDKSGSLLVSRIEEDGHVLADRAIITDDVPQIIARLKEWIESPQVDVVVTTGGTGLTGRDSTPEAFAAIVEKDIPGFGELFRMLSFEKIGTSTVQSRALAGVAGGTYLFALPGSTSACKDGWDDILRYQLDIRHRPCNFVEIMPRLNESATTRRTG